MTLVAGFRRVIDVLDAAHVDYVVVGSTAAAAWGVVRTTRDIDIAMVVSPDAAGQILDGLSADDLYVRRSEASAAMAVGGSFNVLHPATGGKVDVFVVRPDDAFEAERLRRRVRADVFGLSAWVATAEDVTLSKLAWRRTSRSEVQWRDCIELAGSQPLDREYLRRWATVLGVADDLEVLLSAVDSARGD